jgi:hypothetical protein
LIGQEFANYASFMGFSPIDKDDLAQYWKHLWGVEIRQAYDGTVSGSDIEVERLCRERHLDFGAK